MREGTGARGVGSASRGRARLVDRLFTPLDAARLYGRLVLGDWTFAERCSLVLLREILPQHDPRAFARLSQRLFLCVCRVGTPPAR